MSSTTETSAPRAAQAFTPQELAARAIARRAIEAVGWGMPAVNFDLMLQAMIGAGGKPNQIVYWSRPVTWKNQTLTPNPDTIYVMPFYDTTAAGPMVLEIPAADGDHSLVGSIDDAWQTAIEDIGPAGFDQGKGGKYLILPPGHAGEVPAGYLPMRSETWSGFVLIRSSLKSFTDEAIAQAVAYAKRIQFYPLSQAAKPPGTTFIDAIDVLFDSAIPYDLRFFESLDRFVQRESWLARDKVMIELLRTIGIEKGKPFAPDSRVRELLASAAREAQAEMEAVYEKWFPPFAEGARWAFPVLPEVAEGIQNGFADPDHYPIDGRGRLYSYIYFSAKHVGAGQFYLMTIQDQDGQPFDGGKTYRLTVPANPPVRQYWSATVYDRATHTLIRDTRWSSRSSLSTGITKNPDGSTTVYFGPEPPSGKEANWVPTRPGGGFEVLFRLYGPEKPFFDKVWKLPDIENA